MRCFRCNIAWGDARSPGSDDQLYLLTKANQRGLNGGLVIGNNLLVSDLEPIFTKEVSGRWSGDIGSLAQRGGITHGQHSSSFLTHGKTISRAATHLSE